MIVAIPVMDCLQADECNMKQNLYIVIDSRVSVVISVVCPFMLPV